MENRCTFAVRNKKRCGFLDSPATRWAIGSKKDFRKSLRVLQVLQIVVHLPPDREIGEKKKSSLHIGLRNKNAKNLVNYL